LKFKKFKVLDHETVFQNCSHVTCDNITCTVMNTSVFGEITVAAAFKVWFPSFAKVWSNHC